MQNNKKKVLRNANWHEEEKKLLAEIIKEKIDIIENKDTKTNTNALKKQAWQEVLVSFNSINPKQRNLNEIQCQWRNYKQKNKTQCSNYQISKNGESSTQEIDYNEFENDNSTYNSDSAFMAQDRSGNPERMEQLLQPNQVLTEEEAPEPKQQNVKGKRKIDYEESLFWITKKAKDREMERAEELHQRRLAILSLEEEYWIMKIKKGK